MSNETSAELTISGTVVTWNVLMSEKSYRLELIFPNRIIVELVTVPSFGSFTISDIRDANNKLPAAVRLRESKLFGRVVAITAFPGKA